jgi:hypothetical protein
MAALPNTLIYTDPRYRNGTLVNESALLAEWLSIKYPGVGSLGRLRLGPTSAYVIGRDIPPNLAAMLSVENWYADAIVLAPGEQLVIEAKVQAKPAAIAEVLFYQRLLSRTPELQAYLQMVFQPVVLFAEADDDVSDFARSLGVRVEVYTPPWIVDYLLRVQFRPRSPASPSS